jgi:hypothetical protein
MNPTLARLCLRMLISREPCLMCAFALATHGKYTSGFGLGYPRLCLDHAKAAIKNDQEDWEPVPDDGYTSNLTRDALKILGLDMKKRSERVWTTNTRITIPEEVIK